MFKSWFNWFKRDFSPLALWFTLSAGTLALLGWIIVSSLTNSATVVEELNQFENEKLPELRAYIVPGCCIDEVSYKKIVDQGPGSWNTINKLKAEEIHLIAGAVKQRFSVDYNNNSSALHNYYSALAVLEDSNRDVNYQESHYFLPILKSDLEKVKKILGSKFGAFGNLHSEAYKLSELECNSKIRIIAHELAALKSFEQKQLEFTEHIKVEVKRLSLLGITSPISQEKAVKINKKNIEALDNLTQLIEKKLLKLNKHHSNIVALHQGKTPCYVAKLMARRAIADYFYNVALTINELLQPEKKKQKIRGQLPSTENLQPASHQQPAMHYGQVSDARKQPYMKANAPSADLVNPPNYESIYPVVPEQ